MKKFKVILSRNYIIEINAIDKDDAKQLSEYFISSGTDISNINEQKEHKFKIDAIEMVVNESIEAEEIYLD